MLPIGLRSRTLTTLPTKNYTIETKTQAHTQKQPFLNFRLQLAYYNAIAFSDPDFLFEGGGSSAIGVRIQFVFGTFYPDIRHISISVLLDLMS